MRPASDATPAGIPASASLDGSQEPDALERRVRALEWEQLRSAPGTRWEYANDGFNIAGLIVQVVSGMPYEQYVDEQDPEAARDGPHDLRSGARGAELGLAQGYVKRKGSCSREQTRLTRAYNPSGMLLSDAEDAGRYLAALRERRRARRRAGPEPESVQRMWTPAADVSDGLGVRPRLVPRASRRGSGSSFHPGEILTMGSTFVLVPERKLGVAVLTEPRQRRQGRDRRGRDPAAARLRAGPAHGAPDRRGEHVRAESGASGIGTSASTRRRRGRCASPATATSWSARSWRSASSLSRSRTPSS